MTSSRIDLMETQFQAAMEEAEDFMDRSLLELDAQHGGQISDALGHTVTEYQLDSRTVEMLPANAYQIGRYCLTLQLVETFSRAASKSDATDTQTRNEAFENLRTRSDKLIAARPLNYRGRQAECGITIDNDNKVRKVVQINQHFDTIATTFINGNLIPQHSLIELDGPGPKGPH